MSASGWSGRLALATLVVGVVASAVVLLATRDVSVTVTTSPAALVLVATAVLAASFLVVGLSGRLRHRTRDALARQSADLAAQAQAREQEVRADVERTLHAGRARLLGRLDHELKNPVMATNLAVARLQQAEPGSPDAAEALAVIATQSKRFAGLLQNLRKITDVEHRDLDLEQVDLGELLTALRDECSATDAGRGREWTLTVPRAPWPLPTVTADPDLLYLALHNLVDNAVKYTRPGDHVELRASETGGGVLVEVADTGAGIPDAEVAGVWDELSRASTAHGVPGQGLGLALVRSVVRRHGGHVDLRSRVGKGTSATVWLPVGGPTPPTPIPPPASRPRSTR